MSSQLDELYFQWLYSLVADSDEHRKSRTYWNVLRQLFGKEFVWLIPNDDNRIEDGRYLRIEFIEALDLHDIDPEWMNLGCSIFELIVGLARRLVFAAEGETAAWFWHLIGNLGIRYNDNTRFNPEEVEEILDNLNFRTYEPDGRGGLFPLKHPHRDQTKLELWFQMQSYLLEL